MNEFPTWFLHTLINSIYGDGSHINSKESKELYEEIRNELVYRAIKRQ